MILTHLDTLILEHSDSDFDAACVRPAVHSVKRWAVGRSVQAGAFWGNPSESWQTITVAPPRGTNAAGVPQSLPVKLKIREMPTSLPP